MAHDDRFSDFNARQRQHADDQRRYLSTDDLREMACPDCGLMLPIAQLVDEGCPICDAPEQEPINAKHQ